MGYANARNNFSGAGALKFGKFYAGKEEGKGTYRGCISLVTSVKGDDGYYKDFLLPFVAFGGDATHLNSYANDGDTVVVSGELRMSDDYTKDGVEYKGRVELYISSVYIPKQKGAANNTAATTAKAAAPAAPKPAAAKFDPSKLRR